MQIRDPLRWMACSLAASEVYCISEDSEDATRPAQLAISSSPAWLASLTLACDEVGCLAAMHLSLQLCEPSATLGPAANEKTAHLCVRSSPRCISNGGLGRLELWCH